MAEGLRSTCGRPTANGSCRAPPFGGSSGEACYRHAGLGTTAAQRTAVRGNALQHGFYTNEFLSEPARALMQHAQGIHDPRRLLDESLAIAMVQFGRIFEWEGRKGRPSKAGNLASSRLRRQMRRLGPSSAPRRPPPPDYDSWKAVHDADGYRALLAALAAADPLTDRTQADRTQAQAGAQRSESTSQAVPRVREANSRQDGVRGEEVSQ